ncbi:phage major capsid protein, partial [Bifidobacterium jacchi]
MADPTMNRQSGGLDLTPETQAEIWQTATYQSAFMQLVPQINLPGKGVRVPIITGDPEADWVQEGAEKPKSGVGFSKKDMVPYTIAVILPFSNQFRRAGHPAGIADQRVRPVDHHDRRQAGQPVGE